MTGMRKVTVELIPNAQTKDIKKGIFNKILSIEALQILKTDFDKGVRLGIGICTVKRRRRTPQQSWRGIQGAAA
jgi:hypothetical protein